jgi:putative transcriptional regulator
MANQEKNLEKKGRPSKAAVAKKASVRTHRSVSSSSRTPRAYKSAAFAAIHEGMSDLHSAGMIDATTMREFDEACLTPVMTITAQTVRNIRAKACISQAVFAAHLNVTTGVVSKWERGEKHPRGPAAKLLTLAAKNGIAAIA